MAEYIANFEFRKNTLEFQGEVSKNELHADLIIDYRPNKTSQLLNDSGYITISDVPTKLSELVNDTGFITASSLIPLEDDIVEIESDILGLQNSKVDKVTGKGLSTNDFTNALKTKLEGIEAGAEVNKVNSVNGQIGDVSINIPTKTSDLTNDSNFATVSQIPTNNNQLVNGAGYITSADLPTKLSDLTNDTGFITNSVNNLTNYYTKLETYTKQEITQLIADIPKFEIQIVQALPQTGEAMVLYLVPKVSTAPDVYDEYIWIETSESFELIGTTAVDLTGYATEQWVLDKGYITGIDGSDVTNALGYTPYSATNPNNYTSVVESTVSGWGFTKNTGTVTSVNNVQPVNGNVTLPSSEYNAGMGLQLSDQNEFDIMQEDEKESSIIEIGNPVEVENLVYTGFSTSNYLKASQQIQIGASDTFEIAIKFKQSNTQNGSIVFCGGSDYSNYIQIYLSRLSNQYIYSLQSFGTIGRMRNDITSLNSITQSINTYIWLRIRRASLTMYFDYSTDGSTWVNMGSQQIYSSTLGTSIFNFYLGNGADISNYPCTVATIDLNYCYIKVNDVTVWNGSGIISKPVAKATNNLYGLVKPDNTTITVNDGVLSANIANSVDSSSTNNQAVGAKLFYDTVGDIETILASI